MIRYIYFFFSTMIGTVWCQYNRFVYHDNTEFLKITGRVLHNDSLCELYWPGTSIKANFEGRDLYMLFKDQTGDNYYNIIIDGKLSQIIKPDTIKKLYTLAANISNEPHTLEIFKRTEWDRGTGYFYGLMAPKSTIFLPADSTSKLKIEYFGNSITAGYAVEDTTGKDRPQGSFSNHYLSYAALTARHFDADHHCTCKSGIGVMISWFPLTMPQLYNRLNPNDSSSKWDFNTFQPDIVVVNLLQNDSWLVKKKDFSTFKSTFGNTPPSEAFIISSYEMFIKNIRKAYPKCHIICMLGNMDITKTGSKWPGYVAKAVDNLADIKIHTLFIPFKGTHIHPLITDQQLMSKQLIKYIEDNKLNLK